MDYKIELDEKEEGCDCSSCPGCGHEEGDEKREDETTENIE